MQLTSADAQLLTDHLMAHTTMKRSNIFAANGKVLFFSRLCPERKLLSDSSSNSYRNEVMLSLPEAKSSGEVRTKSLGTDSSSFPAPIVKKVWVRADMAKNKCLDNFVTPCRFLWNWNYVEKYGQFCGFSGSLSRKSLYPKCQHSFSSVDLTKAI